MAGSIQDYDEVLKKVADFTKVSDQIGEDVKIQANLAKQAFDAQRKFLVTVSGRAKPSEGDFSAMLKSTSENIATVQKFKNDHHASKHINHLSSVSEAVAALGWVAVASRPSESVKQTMDSTKFYTNRVLKEFKKTNPVHGEWVDALIAALCELEKYVKQRHSNALTWGK